KRTANPRSDPGSSIRSGAFLPLDALFDGKPRELRRYPFKCSAQTLALYSGTIFPITRDHVIRSIPMDGTVAPFWATLPFGTFADESYEFVEWGLLGGGGRFRTAFTRFASAAANGPQDAADFQQCFGMNYAQALRLLWADTATAQPQSFRWQSNRPLPQRLKFVPVDARAAERLEQEWRDRIGFPGTRAQTEDPLSRIE
ncbi:MAG TPA: hypothetical protein VFE31_00030, partial [Opitutaceae bacterium]|nr:hypothetical protein [Opitutaceae bacterium]